MKKILIILLSFFALTNSVIAKELQIINNGSPTGINSQLLQEYAKEFFDYDIKVRSTNSNCAISKNLWENSSGKTLYILTTNIDASTDKTNKACFVPIVKENTLFINYSAPIEFCSVGEKTWNDFIKKDSNHVVGITATTSLAPEFILGKISEHYKTNLKLIRSNANSDFMTLAKSKEVDFGFRTGLSGLEMFKERCFWNSSQIESKEEFAFLRQYPEKYNSLYEESVILHKNITSEEINKFREKLHRSWNSEASISLRKRRGYDDSRVSYQSENERIKLFDSFLKKFQ